MSEEQRQSTPDALRDEGWRRRLDWGLGETEGGAVPPDVTAAVLARIGGGAAPRAHPPRRWLLAAALVLLGAGAVLGTWLSRGDRARDAQVAVQPPQERTGPPEISWHSVASRRDLALLPAGVRHIELVNPDDDDLAALRRCRHLEGLRLRAASRDGRPAVLLSPAALPHLAAFDRLRVLEICFQSDLSDAPLDVLAGLPLLEKLRLSLFDTRDEDLAVLERLPSLRRLDLSSNQGFRHEGMRVLARLPGLRELDLRACSQLSVAMLAPLADMPRLEKLVLSGIGKWHRGVHTGHDTEAARARHQAFWEKAEADGAGLTPEVLEILPQGLRALGLADTEASFDDAVMRALVRRLPDLEELDVSGCEGITDVGVAELLALRGLRRLDLSRCKGLTRHGLALVAQATQLREVRLDELPWLQLEHLEPILARGIRVSADKRADPAFARAVAQLAQRHFAFDEPEYLVVTAAGVGDLPEAAFAVEGHDLSDEDVTRLVRRAPRLRHLRLRTGEQKVTYSGTFSPQTGARNHAAFTGASLHDVAQLDELVGLELAGTVGLAPGRLAALQRLPALERLTLAAFDLTDAALAALPAMPSLQALRIELSFGWGEAGMRAIAACKGLEELTLRALPQLTGTELALVGGITSLRRLQLANMGVVRNDSGREVTADERARRDAAIAAEARPETGVTDATLRGLAKLTALEVLELPFGAYTGAGVRELAPLAALRELDLTYCRNVTAEDLRHLPRSLRSLDLDRCAGVGAGTGAALSGMRLERLVLASADVTDEDVATLVGEQPLSLLLDLTGCGQLTAATAELLANTPRIQRLAVSGCAGWTEARLLRAGDRIVPAKIW